MWFVKCFYTLAIPRLGAALITDDYSTVYYFLPALSELPDF